jgi:hypothetical protein
MNRPLRTPLRWGKGHTQGVNSDTQQALSIREGICSIFQPEESWAFGPPQVMKTSSHSATTVAGSAALPFVISTEAYPDFLLRGTYQGYGCGFP